jgi:nucleotide-binding universal stress UspA family protein
MACSVINVVSGAESAPGHWTAQTLPTQQARNASIPRGTRRASGGHMASSQPYVVVVGVDYSTTGDLAFDRALRLCQLEPVASLHVVTVAHWTPGTGDAARPLDDDLKQSAAEHQAELESYVEKKVSALRSGGRPVPERIHTHVRWEAPSEQIAQLASDVEADLVVVGTHGRRGLSRVLMGSVAEVVVRLAPCPVLVVRPKGILKMPVIEPPCPECLKARAASSGATYWCAQHSEHQGQRHGSTAGDARGRSSRSTESQ